MNLRENTVQKLQVSLDSCFLCLRPVFTPVFPLSHSSPKPPGHCRAHHQSCCGAQVLSQCHTGTVQTVHGMSWEGGRGNARAPSSLPTSILSSAPDPSPAVPPCPEGAQMQHPELSSQAQLSPQSCPEHTSAQNSKELLLSLTENLPSLFSLLPLTSFSAVFHFGGRELF